MAYPMARLTDDGEIREASRGGGLVVGRQRQDKRALKAEGLSYCTMEMDRSGPAVQFSITHTIEREPSKFIAAVPRAWRWPSRT
jgi:hypothetical protein